MNNFFKWLLIIILAILVSPLVLLFGSLIVALLELIVAAVIVMMPIWVPVCAVGVIMGLIDE